MSSGVLYRRIEKPQAVLPWRWDKCSFVRCIKLLAVSRVGLILVIKQAVHISMDGLLDKEEASPGFGEAGLAVIPKGLHGWVGADLSRLPITPQGTPRLT